MDLSIIVPWRPSDPQRTHIVGWVVARYHNILKDLGLEYEIICVDDNSQPFSRSGSKNQGLRQARGRVVLFADADCIQSNEWLQESFERCHDQAVWCVPHRCTLLEEEITTAWTTFHPGTPIADLPPRAPEDIEWSGVTSVGGSVMVSQEGANAVYGYDERFGQWGYEDGAFAMALSTLWGPRVQSHELFHLWHPKDLQWEQPQIGHHAKLFQRYEAAAYKSDLMLQLVSEDERSAI